MADEDVGERLLAALDELLGVTYEIPAELAPEMLDEAILEIFWRDWPALRSWGESLWQRTQRDLVVPATPASDPELDEVGGEG